jgi:prevent-host-death family protein
MNVASSQEVAAHFDDFIEASESGPVVVTRKGKPVAVLLCTKNDDDLERLLLGHSRKLQTILEAARKRFREGGGISHEAFWKEVEAEKPSPAAKKGRSGGDGGTPRKSSKATPAPSAAD